MKKQIIIGTIALVAVMAFTSSCVAAPPHGRDVDPGQFMDLLDEPSAPAGESGESRTVEPVAEAPVTVSGSQVQRLLEESELILRGIAAEAGPSREELQNASMRALDVIRSYIERLPKKSVPVPVEDDNRTSQTNAPASSERHVVEDPGLGSNADVAVVMAPVAVVAEAEPASSSVSRPAAAAAREHVDDALVELVAKLREVAAAAETRASELERLTRALEESQDE
jgi:hypothetical protein